MGLGVGSVGRGGDGVGWWWRCVRVQGQPQASEKAYHSPRPSEGKQALQKRDRDRKRIESGVRADISTALYYRVRGWILSMVMLNSATCCQ